MAVHLSLNQIKKLSHESNEIRLLAFYQIETKLLRCMAHNEIVTLKSHELAKQLIRWFGFRPKQEHMRVARLILELLRSPYGKTVINKFSIQRLQWEFRKIEQLITNDTNTIAVIHEIQDFLHVKQQESNNNHNYINGPQKEQNIHSSAKVYCSVDAIEADTETNETTSETASNTGSMLSSIHEFENVWSKPTTSDYTLLTQIANLLIDSDISSIELQNTLHHLQLTMCDYPPEFMLQPPHIYLKLIQLREQAATIVNCNADDIDRTMLIYLNLLQQRIHMRRKTLNYASATSHQMLAATTTSNTQLQPQYALKLLLQQCLGHLKETVCAINNNDNGEFFTMELMIQAFVVYKELRCPAPVDCYEQLYMLSARIRDHCEQAEHFTLLCTKQMLIIALLQDNIERELCSSGGGGSLLSKQQAADLLEPLLTDYAFTTTYTKRTALIKNILIGSNLPKYAITLKYVEQYADALKLAIDLLSKRDEYPASDIVKRSSDICLTLPMLDSQSLLLTLFNSVVDCHNQNVKSPEMRKKCIELVLTLLQQPCKNLRSTAYSALNRMIKKHIGCLMTGECFDSEVSNEVLIKNQIIGVPFSSELMYQLIEGCYLVPEEIVDDESKNIQKLSFDTLCILLRSETLFGDHWKDILKELVLPVLPLLQCCSVYAPEHMLKFLLDLTNPDRWRLPPLDLLRGNIWFLFHPDADVRSEALSRIIYILQSLSQDDRFVPNLHEIQDLLANDICVQTTARDFAEIILQDRYSSVNQKFRKDTAHMNETVLKLIKLLDTPDIEPSVRKVTLMQLNLMSHNTSALNILCDLKPYGLITKALEQSLQKDNFHDYTDTAIPTISLFSKIFFSDSHFRSHYAISPEFHVLLLRALFVHVHDIQMRQDSALCLFQLICSNYLSDGDEIVLPAIMKNFIVPLKFKSQPPVGMSTNLDVEHSSELVDGHFRGSVIAQQSYWRLHIAHLLNSNYFFVQNTQLQRQPTKNLDISSVLHPTARDFRYIQAIQPGAQLNRILRSFANATEHKTLITNIVTLKRQLLLLEQQHDPIMKFISVSCANDLGQLITKYLQLLPGNKTDYLVYEHFLELANLCVNRVHLPNIMNAIRKLFHKDFLSTPFLLLKRENFSLQFYHKLTTLLYNSLNMLALAASSMNPPEHKYPIHFNSNFFELVTELAVHAFKKRKLLRVRCLLPLLRLSCNISNPVFQLTFSDEKRFKYANTFLKLSLELKSYTQTGTQWQRDCLQIVCQLRSNFTHPQMIVRLHEKHLKFASGLAGHADVHVRALAWALQAQMAETARPVNCENINEDGLNTNSNGVKVLQHSLSYLPGGFLACCLSSLLDVHESILVRQFAGQLFILMLPHSHRFSDVLALLQLHNFFDQAHDALHAIELRTNFEYNDGKYYKMGPRHSCEIISCYVRICQELLYWQPNYSPMLCQESFMTKLYEILKLETPEPSSYMYRRMCADICQLYAMCARHAFTFLQRTLCRDAVFQLSVYRLLDMSNCDDITVKSREDNQLILVSVMQLMLVLIQDTCAYTQICDQMCYSPFIFFGLLMNAFQVKLINTPLQRVALSTFALSLLKTSEQEQLEGFDESHDKAQLDQVASEQSYPRLIVLLDNLLIDNQSSLIPEHNTTQLLSQTRFTKNLTVSDNNLEKSPTTGTSDRSLPPTCYKHSNISKVSSEGVKVLFKSKLSIKSTSLDSDDTNSQQKVPYRAPPATTELLPLPAHKPSKKHISIKSSTQPDQTTIKASAVLFILLHRIMQQHYTLKLCKFQQQPQHSLIQICETLSVLLRYSAEAQCTAVNLKLFDYIIHILNTFFNDFQMSCTTFVRRHGEAKKLAIIRNLMLLFNIILQWHSCTLPTEMTMITNEARALSLIRVLGKVWPWLTHSAELKLLILRICEFASEHSLIVCKQLANISGSGNTDSVLHLMVKLVKFETGQVRAIRTANFPVINAALRAMTNCCSCAEGRLTLIKSHVLDIFDAALPLTMSLPSSTAVTKSKMLRLRPEILNSWLQFWAIYSRYDECAETRQIHVLITHIERTEPRNVSRLICLRVLRNLCFRDSNRNVLASNNQFWSVIISIVSEPLDYVEEGDVCDGNLTVPSYEEQYYVCVAIWKFISGGVKYVALLRSTKLFKRLCILRENLTLWHQRAERHQLLKNLEYRKPLRCIQNLSNIIDTILKVFSL